MIQVKCRTKDSLPLSALTEFQGELKIRDEEDYRKIIASITKYGFAFPFFVWKDGETNNVLDGHGRFGALKRMEAAGTKIPPLPVTYIDAKDHAEAVKLLIKLNERFGTITEAGFKEFADYEGLDIEDVELPNISNIEDLLYADEEISEAFENIKSMTSNVATQTEPHTQQEPFIAYCQGCGAFVEVPREKLEEIVNVN